MFLHITQAQFFSIFVGGPLLEARFLGKFARKIGILGVKTGGWASIIGLARLIEISVNRSIYKRKTIIDMKIQKSVTFNVFSVLFIQLKSKRNCLLLFSISTGSAIKCIVVNSRCV